MEEDKTELQKTDTSLYTADGTKLVVKGQVNVHVKLGTENCKQNVIVANIEDLAGILGMVNLETQDVEIKIEKRVLDIKRQNVPLEKIKSNIGFEVKQSNDVTIPTKKGEIGLIESTNFVDKGLLLAKSYFDSKAQNQRLYLVDVKRPVKLGKNTTIEVVNELDLVSDVGASTFKSVESLKTHSEPEHRKQLLDSPSEYWTERVPPDRADMAFKDEFEINVPDEEYSEFVNQSLRPCDICDKTFRNFRSCKRHVAFSHHKPHPEVLARKDKVKNHSYQDLLCYPYRKETENERHQILNDMRRQAQENRRRMANTIAAAVEERELRTFNPFD
ncbi:unnamed protein product [Mytilus coruscus]|uniref:C2H2-type domain-containing protein n=1 Tax=Mytilus coruscus TaxID=42192 RepID=A0A6J8EAR8_MYTCO|nr:unnamed protein product [Mytilus coruscus]